ncbi:MAG TPA: hypothetical protein VFE42_02290 [Chloroflexota bacterium]|nr:hypothetical protein [Chloroflexota bacterium]
MRYRVIDPGGAVPTYALPDGLGYEGSVALPRPAPEVADPALRGTDGRVATAGVPGDRPPEQAPWGFGFAPAQPVGPAAEALTLLAMNPTGFTVRQQDAVRRDLGRLLPDAVSYTPLPFAAADEEAGG